MLERCAEKSQLIVEVGKEVGWSKLWDSVMDLGPRHVRGLQNLSRMFSAHGRGKRPCPLCDELEGLLAEHVMEEDREILNLEMTFEIMMERLKMVDLNFVTHLCSLLGDSGVFFERSGLLATIYALNHIHCTYRKLNEQ